MSRTQTVTTDVLQDYLTGRLDAQARSQVERAIARDPEARQRCSLLRGTSQLLRNHVPRDSDVPQDWIDIIERNL